LQVLFSHESMAWCHGFFAFFAFLLYEIDCDLDWKLIVIVFSIGKLINLLLFWCPVFKQKVCFRFFGNNLSQNQSFSKQLTPLKLSQNSASNGTHTFILRQTIFPDRKPKWQKKIYFSHQLPKKRDNFKRIFFFHHQLTYSDRGSFSLSFCILKFWKKQTIKKLFNFI